jgi:hypothetical protein
MLQPIARTISCCAIALVPVLAGAAPPCPPTPAQRDYVKFYTGHYVQHTKIDTAFMNEIRLNSGIRGAMKRYDWADLEPRQEKYEFGQIRADLARLKAQGKKLVVFVQYKYASPPAYLRDLAGDGYRHPLTGEGPHAENKWLAAFDNLAVSKQFIKLLNALSQLDTDSGLAAIVFNETATSADLTEAQGKAFYTNLMKQDKAAACAFKHTPVIQLTNFLGRYRSLFASSYRSGQIGLGGPDTLMKDESLSGDGKSYDFIQSLQRELPVAMNVAAGNYWYNNREEFLGKKHDKTPPLQRILDIADYAKTTLQPNFMFWARYNEDNRPPKVDYMYYDAFRTRAGAGALSDVTNAVCPTAYGPPAICRRAP